jgi:hypothetical protein
MAERIKQLTIVTEDRPGMLSEVVGLIASQGVNIDAINAYGVQGKAVFRITTEDNQKVLSGLEAKGWEVKEEEVIVVELENRPGALGEIAGRLKEKGVNLSYCYGSTGSRGESARFIMKADDNDKAMEALA